MEKKGTNMGESLIEEGEPKVTELDTAEQTEKIAGEAADERVKKVDGSEEGNRAWTAESNAPVARID
jgi:hypothetical protein